MKCVFAQLQRENLKIFNCTSRSPQVFLTEDYNFESSWGWRIYFSQNLSNKGENKGYISTLEPVESREKAIPTEDYDFQVLVGLSKYRVPFCQ